MTEQNKKAIFNFSSDFSENLLTAFLYGKEREQNLLEHTLGRTTGEGTFVCEKMTEKDFFEEDDWAKVFFDEMITGQTLSDGNNNGHGLFFVEKGGGNGPGHVPINFPLL